MSSNPDFSARDASTGVDPLFLERWSPRAFQPHEIELATLTRIMDAARWSPSCFNAQPWRFFTSTQDTFAEFLDLLVDANQAWAKDASVLGFLVAQKNFEHNGKANDHARFDCGAAWMSMSLQARKEGLHTHGMAGIKFDAIADYLQLDQDAYSIVMAFTIGKLADFDTMSDEQRAAEVPNDRKALAEVWKSI